MQFNQKSLLSTLFISMCSFSLIGCGGDSSDETGVDPTGGSVSAGPETSGLASEGGGAGHSDGAVDGADSGDIDMHEPIADPSTDDEMPPEVPQEGLGEAGVLTAGEIDDMLNLDFYQAYNQRTVSQDQYLPVFKPSNVVTYFVVDNTGEEVIGAEVALMYNGEAVYKNVVGKGGKITVFPEWDNLPAYTTIDVTYKGEALYQGDFHYFEETFIHEVEDIEGEYIKLPFQLLDKPVKVDIALVIDATGSMGDEIRYIQEELKDIVSSVSDVFFGASLNTAIVHYRDDTDEYVVQSQDFSEDLDATLDYINNIDANGGGDFPEAMDAALHRASELTWRPEAVAKIMFVIADAPPHAAKYPHFVDSFQPIRDQGIHVYPIGASGVDERAEYLMRGLAAYTQGSYLFLTDDSGVGNSHAEPKVPCYLVSSLNTLMRNVIYTEVRGEYIGLREQDIIREVGNYDRGICRDDAVDVAFETLLEGTNGRVDFENPVKPILLPIMSSGQFESMWGSQIGDEAALPTVDFEKEMVVLAAMGQKSTGGMRIQITKVEEAYNQIHVYVTEEYPGQGSNVTTAFTSPFHLVTVPTSDKKVEFHVTKNVIE